MSACHVGSAALTNPVGRWGCPGQGKPSRAERGEPLMASLKTSECGGGAPNSKGRSQRLTQLGKKS